MIDVLKSLDRYLVIAADAHAGPDHRQYGPYLKQKWQRDFGDWLRQTDEGLIQIRELMGPRSIAVGGDSVLDGPRNWESARRLAETEADGIVAEVIFSDTSPPFQPMLFTEFGEPEIGTDLDRRWAGIRAHNRWLAHFWREAHGRRAGIAQVYLPNINGSAEGIRWARENGLTGGVLLPDAPPGSGGSPLYAPEYEPMGPFAKSSACRSITTPARRHRILETICHNRWRYT